MKAIIITAINHDNDKYTFIIQRNESQVITDNDIHRLLRKILPYEFENGRYVYFERREVPLIDITKHI